LLLSRGWFGGEERKTIGRPPKRLFYSVEKGRQGLVMEGGRKKREIRGKEGTMKTRGSELA
jgi:hypothetical protein